MKYFLTSLNGVGNWLVSLSDRAKKQLVIVALLGLIGGGIYKLVVSLAKLNDPLPAASPEQLLKPMQKLFKQTNERVSTYEQARQRDMRHLDSSAKAYSDKNLRTQ